ncbi:MAG: hypothetical protein HQL63_05840 [Magnetococcales bacterium]|nr:hypothetical protein [Magnetococcales bacterium]MBF0322012.1 hypothetical protein [Magnetococcales bacterium]
MLSPGGRVHEPSPQENPLTERVLGAFSDYFSVTAFEMAQQVKWSTDGIEISEHALNGALAESRKDVQAILNRRGCSASGGKLTGIITFRVSRWCPIQLSNDLIENPLALKLNGLVPFALCLKYIFTIDIARLPQSITQEFHYNLLRRHTNQETLGLAYDMIEYHV